MAALDLRIRVSEYMCDRISLPISASLANESQLYRMYPEGSRGSSPEEWGTQSCCDLRSWTNIPRIEYDETEVVTTNLPEGFAAGELELKAKKTLPTTGMKFGS